MPDPSGEMSPGRCTASRATGARLSAQSRPGRVDQIPMSIRPGKVPDEGPQRTEEAEATPRSQGPTAATVLLLAIWIGLTAGFLDLGLLLIRKRLIEGDAIRLGEGFPWLIPAGVTVLVLLPGFPLALLARLRRGRGSLGPTVWLLAFVGFLDLSTKFPLEFWSSSLLSAGLAVQATHLISARRQAFLRFVRLTIPLLAGAVLALALATSGARAWSERRAIAALPPPPRSAPNVLLIVWDTVRARNVGLYGHNRPTTPNLQRLAARGTWFRHAFSTSSWTLPSHASMFTGRWPHELSAGWKTPLDDREPTLAGRLDSLGYDTAGFVANLDYLGRESGVARGFAHYDDYPITARDVFIRYIGLGRKLDTFSLAMLVDKLWGGRAGLAPWSRSRGSMPSAPGHRPGLPELALLAARSGPPLLRLPELQRGPHALRGSRRFARRVRHPARVLARPPGLAQMDHARPARSDPARHPDGQRHLRRLHRLPGPAPRVTARRARAARRTRGHGGDRDLGPRRAPGRPLALLPRMQPLPAARRGPAGGRGPDSRAIRPGRRRAGEPARPAGDRPRSGRPGPG